MNRFLLVLLLAAFAVSCSEEKETKEKEPAAEPQVKSVAEIDPKEQKLEQLRKTPTSDLAQMQKMLPAEIAGIKRSKFSMTSNLGYSTAQADYEKDRRTYIHLVLYDCAGQQGAELFRNNFQSQLDVNDSTETGGYRKTIVLMNGKALEKYEPTTKVTTLSFLANDRILFVVAGKNVDAETLKAAAEKMDVKIS